MMEKVCLIPECYRKENALGYCGPHYRRLNGEIDLNKPIRVYIKDRKCSIDGCNEKHEALGYCDTHYKRLKNGTDLLKLLEIHIKNRKCSIIDCNRKYKGLGYCELHYVRFKKCGDPNKGFRSKNKICSIEDCNRKYHAKNYCVYHYKKYINPVSSCKDLLLYIATRNVRNRDKNRCKWNNCMKSAKNGDTIHVHHIFTQSEYPELKYIEEYMICYCKFHHAYWHEKRGDINVVKLIMS